MKKRLFPLVVLSCIGFAATGMAASLRQEDVHVMQRAQFGHDPVGGRLGGLMLYPSLELMENFDDNIYAAKNNKKSDFVSRIKPKLDLRTLNTQRGFQAILEAEKGLYKNRSKENYTDVQGRFSPYWTILRSLTVRADLLHQKLHEQRSDPDATLNNASVQPITYDRTAALFAGKYKRDRFGLELSAERTYLDFDNGTTMAGQSLINDDRNRFENTVGAELSCDITDRSTIYWTTYWLNRDYKRPDFAGVSYSDSKRDSDGVQSVVGLRFPLTPLISLDGNIGIRHQDFSDTAFKDVETGIGRAALTWLVTPLTTIDFTASRNVMETNQDNASSYIQNKAGLVVSHELRRNIVLQMSSGAGTHDYIGLGRDDRFRAAGLAAIYKMNRYLRWRMAYDYDTRKSNISAAEYNRQRVYFSGTVQF